MGWDCLAARHAPARLRHGGRTTVRRRWFRPATHAWLTRESGGVMLGTAAWTGRRVVWSDAAALISRKAACADTDADVGDWVVWARTRAGAHKVNRHGVAGHGVEVALLLEGDRWDVRRHAGRAGMPARPACAGFSQANFSKFVRQTLTATVAVESEWIVHDVPVHQTKRTRRVPLEEPRDFSEPAEEDARRAHGELLTSAPLAEPEESRSRARISERRVVTVQGCAAGASPRGGAPVEAMLVSCDACPTSSPLPRNCCPSSPPPVGNGRRWISPPAGV